MKVWVYDIETLINCFTVTFVNKDDENECRQFVVHAFRDDSSDLIDFFKTQVKGLISFNGIGFDAPVMYSLMSRVKSHDAHENAKRAYEDAQSIISDIPFREDYRIERKPELDLYLMYHFNNEARATSLKWIQCHLGMDNIMEMPHPHDRPVISIDEIKQILEYNLNDVITTLRLYKHPKTKSILDLRKWAQKTYGLRKLSISNAHMGEQIFLSQLGDIPPADTAPRDIYIDNLILPIIQFESKQFNAVLKHFKSIRFRSDEEKPKFGKQIIFAGMKYVFGLGGIHAVREMTCHENVDTLDVKSFYPNIAIQFKLFPKHIGLKFVKIYEKLYNERIATVDPVANNGLKEALNSVFGKSNSIYSPLYDPDFTYSITVNGQLLMAMLAEKITLRKAGVVIMVNTDGMEVKVTDRAEFDKIVAEWKSMTKMSVSQSSYKKIMIRDVNNYIAMKFDGSVKTKGVYEVDKDWNKDPSATVCAIAVKFWFLYGDPVGRTITDWNFTKDFFLYKRAKTGEFYAISPNGSHQRKVQKTTRYLATKIGYTLYQKTDSMNSKVHADTYVTFIDNILALEDDYYEINKMWYITEANKMIVEEEKPLPFNV